jgi:hypothetical protein
MIFFGALAYGLTNIIFYTEDFKTPIRIARYITLGIISCLVISYLFGYYYQTTPCDQFDYSNFGETCVEYNDSYPPMSSEEKNQRTALMFISLFVGFIYSVYKKKNSPIETFRPTPSWRRDKFRIRQ